MTSSTIFDKQLWAETAKCKRIPIIYCDTNEAMKKFYLCVQNENEN